MKHCPLQVLYSPHSWGFSRQTGQKWTDLMDSTYLNDIHNNLLKTRSAIQFRFRKWFVHFWAQQPIKLHPSLSWSWSTMLIGWDCLWLGVSHYVCFPLTVHEHQRCFFLAQPLNTHLRNKDCEEQLGKFDKKTALSKSLHIKGKNKIKYFNHLLQQSIWYGTVWRRLHHETSYVWKEISWFEHPLII